MTTRVTVTDDHALVLEGLVRILSEDPELEVRGGYPSGADLLDHLERDDAIDVVVLDLMLPECSSLDVLSEIVRRWPSIEVLMISAHQRPELAVQWIRAGARGFASKCSDPEEFRTAVHTVAHGELYVAPSILLDVVRALATNEGRAPHETLSPRETEVFLRLADGESTTAISDALCLSPKTVSTYRRRVLDKLEASSNADLTRYALHHQLLTVAVV